MADLDQFAKNMAGLARRVDTNIDRKLVKKVALVASSTVIMATPVDKGQARGGWHVSVGTPSVAETGELDPSGAKTVAKAASEIASAPKEVPIFLNNNVDHIVPLNQGHSAQAPANFVEQAIAKAVASVQDANILE